MGKSDFTLRQRTGTACIPCRKRKVKCNGARPCCKHCLRVRDKCTWPALIEDFDAGQVEGSESQSPRVPSVAVDIPENQVRILLNVFFSIPHLAFIRQSVHQPSFETTPLLSQPPFLLVAVCSLAALHVSEHDVVNVFNGEAAAQLSQRLAKAAQGYSRELSDQPSVTAVQGNVILSLRELYCRNITAAWMYTGLAIRMAQEMRLGKEYFQNHPPREQELRRRALWTCFIMDRMLCFLTARPQVFRTRHISIQLPSPARNFILDQAFQGPGISDFRAPVLEHAEVLPFFLKAVDLWSVLIDLFGTVGNSSPEGLVEDEDEFLKAHNTALDWVNNLPPRMTWSTTNYRTFCLLGEGNLFVSMHMLLNHALCTLQQAHLPQAHDVLPPTSPDPASSQEIAATCYYHANVVANIACSLYEGDAHDRDSLRSPFSGAAILSSACVQLWSHHSKSQLGEGIVDNITQKVSSLLEILRSWQETWPIASSWIESIELINTLYAVAYGTGGVEPSTLDLGQGEGLDLTSVTGQASGSVGLPEPSNVSPRLFEKIRHIMFTISEPSALRRLQSQLHIRNLWSHMSLQAQMTSIDSCLFDDAGGFSMDDATQVPFGWSEYMTMLDGQHHLS